MQEQAIIISGKSDLSVVQSNIQILSYNKTSVKWYSFPLQNKVCSLSLKQKFHQPILQHSEVHFTVDRSFFKEKKGHYLLCFNIVQNLSRISHMLQYCMKMLSSPYACVVLIGFASCVEDCFVAKHNTVIKSVFFYHHLYSTNVFASWFVSVFRILVKIQFVRYHMQVIFDHPQNGC